MGFEEKKNKAITLMEGKNMWRSNYAPPILRLVWKLGGKMPPLPFAPFWQTLLLFTLTFGALWGIFMGIVSGNNADFSSVALLIASCKAGLIFGVLMALFHHWRRRANGLPRWESL